MHQADKMLRVFSFKILATMLKTPTALLPIRYYADQACKHPGLKHQT